MSDIGNIDPEQLGIIFSLQGTFDMSGDAFTCLDQADGDSYWQSHQQSGDQECC